MPANDDFFRFGRSAAVLTDELRKRYPIDPRFALLDPLRPGVDLDLLRRRLFDRAAPAPAELLLIIDVARMSQLGAALHTLQDGRGTLAADDRLAVERVDRLLGEGWREECLGEPYDPADDRLAAAVALRVAVTCGQRLTGGTLHQAVSLPVRLRPQLNPAHVLLLVTARVDAPWRLADALGHAGLAVEQAWHAERIEAVPPGTPTVFGDAPLFRSEQYLATNSAGWIRQIGLNLTRLLDRHGMFRPGDHVPEIYGNTLGQAWASHVRAAVFRLHQQGRVAATGRGEFWLAPFGGPRREVPPRTGFPGPAGN